MLNVTQQVEAGTKICVSRLLDQGTGHHSAPSYLMICHP